MDSLSSVPDSQQPSRSFTHGHDTGIQTARNAPSEAWQLLNSMDSTQREQLFGGTDRQWNEDLERGSSICKLLVSWARQRPYHDCFGEEDVEQSEQLTSHAGSVKDGAEQLLMMEKRAQAAFDAYKERFPTSIWHCCKHFCFSSIAISPEKFLLFHELRLIHDVSEQMHSRINNSCELVETRRRGVGGSYVGFVAPSRIERDSDVTTDRQRRLRSFANFVIKVLPFLYGQ